MKSLIVALTFVGVFAGSCVYGDDPDSFNNDSIKNAGNLKLIQVQKHAQKNTQSREPVLEDALPSQPPSDGQQSPIAQGPQGKMQARFSVINVDGPKAPAIIAGKTIRQGPRAEDRNSIRVVEFWATWCGPCTQTIPILSKLQEIYGKRNIVVMGYSSEENEDLVRAYVKDKGPSMNYVVRSDPQARTEGPFSAIWQVDTIPHAYVVAHNGTILWHGNPGNAAMLERAIVEAIQYRDIE